MKINPNVRNAVFSLFFVFITANEVAATPIAYNQNSPLPAIGRQVEILIDTFGRFTSENIGKEGNFRYNKKESPIFFLHDKILWGRISIKNLSLDSNIFLCIQYPNISEIIFYKENTFHVLDTVEISGNMFATHTKSNSFVDYHLPLGLPPGDSGTFYFRIKSLHPVELRMTIMNTPEIAKAHSLQSLIMATYLGIIASLFFYNLFLFFATRDRSYLVYVIYLFTLSFAQFTLAGWSFKYFWPEYPLFNNYAVIWTSSFAGTAAVAFAIYFLHTSTYLPKTHKILLGLIGVNIFTFLLSFSPLRFACYQILNFSGIFSGIILLYVAAAIYARGYRPGLYYLFAWSAFLVGLIILVLGNEGLLPVNNFTTYVLYGGAAIEAILLSFALADKINILRKEKDASQASALKISQENEKLVREQNVELERKVAERTEELQLANNQVTSAFKDLKDTQIQLVESEKMASLGQLTAGIAHEINNPINFVKSNIKPLQLDFKDLLEVIGEYEKLHHTDIASLQPQLENIASLKKEIDLDFVKEEIGNLMKGIENGAERTAEIVRGLRTFSRLDESVIKTVNIHEGIDSTLVLLRSNIPANINVVKDYCDNGNIECYPGKLNQVFMNVLSNAVHAITTKDRMCDNEEIRITTTRPEENRIEIKIKDTGKGMTDEVRQKIYEPFFTTKEVGEGTGLGMAIVFKIIQEHGGRIEVFSTEGNGSEFIITLQETIPGKPII